MLMYVGRDKLYIGLIWSIFGISISISFNEIHT